MKHAAILRTRLRQAEDARGKLNRLADCCRDSAGMIRARYSPDLAIVADLERVANEFDCAADLLHDAIKSASQRCNVREPS